MRGILPEYLKNRAAKGLAKPRGNRGRKAGG